jgi:hypothetical protein
MVRWKLTDVAEEHIASIHKVEYFIWWFVVEKCNYMICINILYDADDNGIVVTKVFHIFLDCDYKNTRLSPTANQILLTVW